MADGQSHTKVSPSLTAVEQGLVDYCSELANQRDTNSETLLTHGVMRMFDKIEGPIPVQLQEAYDAVVSRWQPRLKTS